LFGKLVTTVAPTTSSSRTETILEIQSSLQQLVRDSREGFKAIAKRHGLTYYQASALLVVHRRGGESAMSPVAEALNMPPSTVTSIFDALVARDLVVRVAARRDRRQVVASLTEAGQILVGSLLAATQEAFADRFAAVPTDALEPFRTVLMTIAS
jgi:DNA-binding MarR family transcriptional regulator